jgi:hypothetical protein
MSGNEPNMGQLNVGSVTAKLTVWSFLICAMDRGTLSDLRR